MAFGDEGAGHGGADEDVLHPRGAAHARGNEIAGAKADLHLQGQRAERGLDGAELVHGAHHPLRGAHGPADLFSLRLSGEVDEERIAGEFEQAAGGPGEDVEHRGEVVVHDGGELFRADLALRSEALRKCSKAADIGEEERAMLLLSLHAPWARVLQERINQVAGEVGGELIGDGVEAVQRVEEVAATGRGVLELLPLPRREIARDFRRHRIGHCIGHGRVPPGCCGRWLS